MADLNVEFIIEALLAHAHLPYHLRGKRLEAKNHSQNMADAEACIARYGELIARLKQSHPHIYTRVVAQTPPA